MPMPDAETEQAILRYYNINSLFPEEWPAAKDQATEDEEAATPAADAKAKHVRRYTQLERGPRTTMDFNKGRLPQHAKDASLPPMPKDEADPLGTSASTIALLRQKRTPVDLDPEYRNKFMLSSTQFSPNTYLHQLHNTSSTNELMRGLEFLSNSVEKKSATLKVLVESNFEKFVRAKATLDNVYSEMKSHGETSQRTSRQGPNHFRKVSAHAQEKRKNALVEESEFGTIGMRRPLVEATSKAQEIWGPALGGREREDHLKLVLASIETNKYIFDTGHAIEDCIKRRDYESLTEEYAKIERYANEARAIAARVKENDARMTDQQMHQIIITGRVLLDVNHRIEDFKRDTWRRLTASNITKGSETPDGKQEEYMELIAILLQLGVEENPISVWLKSRDEHLRSRVTETFERVRRDLEVVRRRIGGTPKPTAKVLASHLRAAARTSKTSDSDLDTHQIIRFWEKETTSLSGLLAIKGGLLGEIAEFWETSHAFITGQRQRTLPQGIDGRSRHHHRLAPEIARELQGKIIALFGLVKDQLRAIFVDPPIEDVEALFSPSSPVAKTPSSSLMSPSKMSRFTFDAHDIPPPLPPTSEAWEKFAFWPPHSNSLSAVTFLAKIINKLGIAAAELAQIEVVKQDPQTINHYRSLVGEVRERSISAVCAAWIADSENCRELEDWTRTTDKTDVTNMPSSFSAYETAMLNGLQKIVYIPEASQHPGSRDVVLPPPPRHIDTVSKGFKSSLYKAFAGMMEHAAKPMNGAFGDSESGPVDLTVPILRTQTLNSFGEVIDGNNNVRPRYLVQAFHDLTLNRQNIRKLLTISNFQSLRTDVIPALTSSFESSFLMTIADDAKTARDVLSQMHARVFQSYTRPTADSLRQLVTTGITSQAYASSDANFRPDDAKPYVYDVLLALVLVHTEVSRTTPQLTPQVLSFLLEQLSQALIEAFKQRTRYSLAALMQATLDVEFLAQTLDQFTTKKASEIQGEIYQALDERTDNDARQRLQNGLPEMKAILKKLRERTKGEFGCFRRPKKPKRDAASGSEHATAS